MWMTSWSKDIACMKRIQVGGRTFVSVCSLIARAYSWGKTLTKCCLECCQSFRIARATALLVYFRCLWIRLTTKDSSCTTTASFLLT